MEDFFAFIVLKNLIFKNFYDFWISFIYQNLLNYLNHEFNSGHSLVVERDVAKRRKPRFPNASPSCDVRLQSPKIEKEASPSQ